VLGAAQASTPEQLLDDLGTVPGIEAVHVNETAYLFVPQPAGNLSAEPGGSLTA